MNYVGLQKYNLDLVATQQNSLTHSPTVRFIQIFIRLPPVSVDLHTHNSGVQTMYLIKKFDLSFT